MRQKNASELDMRGRCSAGQKAPPLYPNKKPIETRKNNSRIMYRAQVPGFGLQAFGFPDSGFQFTYLYAFCSSNKKKNASEFDLRARRHPPFTPIHIE